MSWSSALGEEKASVHYRNRQKGGPTTAKRIADRLGSNARFVPADITVAEELANVIDTAVTEFGGLDVMFNNAGVGGEEGTIEECTDAIFDRIIDINLKAVWRGMKFAAPHIMARGWGIELFRAVPDCHS